MKKPSRPKKVKTQQQINQELLERIKDLEEEVSYLAGRRNSYPSTRWGEEPVGKPWWPFPTLICSNLPG